MHASTFGALGEPNRFQIVELLRSGPRSVGEIVEALGIRQPQVSKHLRVLSGAGIVAAEPRARRRIYRLESERFEEIAAWVDSFGAVWEARLDSLGAYLNTINTRGEEDGGQQER
ncbi:MAG TPA: metalloregulator ArsR/SmtB family transcription factor [Acidimicrobiia bacterium]|nr:metalloregulator ArsR/SmtB family transcription factor [Acidimicrobiia bacterium]